MELNEDRQEIPEANVESTISEKTPESLGTSGGKKLSSEFRAQEADDHSPDPVFCIPGGKCYTLAEIEEHNKSIPKFESNGRN